MALQCEIQKKEHKKAMDEDIIRLILREFSSDEAVLELINEVENKRKNWAKTKKKRQLEERNCKEIEEEYKLKQRKLILKTLENELEKLDNEMKIDEKIIYEMQLQTKKLQEEIIKIDECKYILMNINTKKAI